MRMLSHAPSVRRKSFLQILFVGDSEFALFQRTNYLTMRYE